MLRNRSLTDGGAFVSLSYSFLDVAGLSEKPFKQLSGGESAGGD